MGPSQTAQKANKKDQDQILLKAQNILIENNICEQNEQMFKSYRVVIAKIYLYGHDHLISHMLKFQKEKRIRFLNIWRSINFQIIDLLFQNLVKKKIPQTATDVSFNQISVLSRSNSQKSTIQEKQTYFIGEQLLQKSKVAVIIFVGPSGYSYEENFAKQFYKDKPQSESLFEIIMERLQKIGDIYGFPQTFIFYNSVCFFKIIDFLKNYPYKSKITTCLQNVQPILNLNGNLCLKNKQLGDIIELPNGSSDFYQNQTRGIGIIEKIKKLDIQYVQCIDCENILEKVLDPEMIGLLDKNKEKWDVLYKCTYPQNGKENLFKRIILENDVPKVDTYQNLMSSLKKAVKNKQKSYDCILRSPIWMNSLLFQVKSFQRVLGNLKDYNEFPQMFRARIRPINYWSPVDSSQHKEEACYVFERDLSDLLINNLFKSQGIMVQRQQQYLPVLTIQHQYNWKNAYREYKEKLEQKPKYNHSQVKDVFVSYPNINDDDM